MRSPCSTPNGGGSSGVSRILPAAERNTQAGRVSIPAPARPAPLRATRRRCRVHGLVLHEYGSEGRLRCPLCLVCWWVDAQESLVFTWDLRHSRLYGRPGPPAKESI